jgi:hypothetical protein
MDLLFHVNVVANKIKYLSNILTFSNILLKFKRRDKDRAALSVKCNGIFFSYPYLIG